jgi:putative ABC transport system permease protein
MTLSWTLAARYLGRRKLRTFLTTLAVVFGVLVTFGTNIMLPTMADAFRANILAAAGQVDLTITHRTGSSFPLSLLASVQAIDGVSAASASLNRTVNLPADFFDEDPASPDTLTALALVGIDPIQAQSVRAYPILEGRFLEDEDVGAAVISRSLADTLGASVGEELSLPTTQGETALTVVGIAPSRALPGNEEVLVTLAEAQTLLDRPGQVNAIDVNFDSLDEARRAEIERQVAEAVGPDFHAGVLSAGSELITNLRVGQAMLSVLGVAALFMGGFIIYNTFRTIVSERRRDLAMLRAVGANRRTITGLILTESLIQGIAGTSIGLILGYLLALAATTTLGGVFQQFMHVQVGAPVVTPGLLLGAIVLGVGLTVISGLIPARNAGRVPPLEALRPSVAEVITARAAGFAFLAGAVMVGFALAALLTHNLSLLALGSLLFLVGLVLIGPVLVRPIARLLSAVIARLGPRQGIVRLAEGNLTRQPTRAAVTASATMLGLAVVLMATSLISGVSGGFLDALRQSLGSDYLFIPPAIAIWGANVGSGPKLADELRALPAVDAVSTLRAATSNTGATPFTVLGIDPVAYPKVAGLIFQKGDPQTAYDDLAQGRTLIANGALSAFAGLTVGDKVLMLTAEGEQSYRVIAVANDYLNAKVATAYVSQASMENDFHITEDVMLQLNLREGADREAADGQIMALAAAYPQFRVIDGQKYYDENKQIFDAAFLGVYFVLIFLAIPSLVAMVNTLAIGVIERTREIGMVRAVGATVRQVRRMVLIEALILALLGTLLGMAGGLYLGRLALDGMAFAGYPVRSVFPWAAILSGLVIGLLFGALAAIIPARQAARMDVVAALRYE